jgi:hypothetical protein
MRSRSAVSSSTELEWVQGLLVLLLTPSSFNFSTSACDFTSKSRASSLILRDLFIYKARSFLHLG